MLVRGRSDQHGWELADADGTHDRVVFENYDDTNYGYLRIIVTAAQLRIEYHPASDGAGAKTPDDFVTVDLATRMLGQYAANDLGAPAAAAAVRRLKANAPPPAKTTTVTTTHRARR
jgi:hypothetical protein